MRSSSFGVGFLLILAVAGLVFFAPDSVRMNAAPPAAQNGTLAKKGEPDLQGVTASPVVLAKDGHMKSEDNGATPVAVRENFSKLLRLSEKTQSQVFSDMGRYVDRARRGEIGISTASFVAVANRAGGLKSLPGYSDADWTAVRHESFAWLDAAAKSGDLYAMWLYGGQVEMLLDSDPEMPTDKRVMLEEKARGHLFSLVSNGLLEAFPRTVGYYLDGTLGKRDPVMAGLVLERYFDLGGPREAVANLEPRVRQALTPAQNSEVAHLLSVMKAHPTSAEIGRRI